MEVTSTKAALVADGDVEADSRLTVTLPRADVEAAVAADEQPELVLDVLRATGGEGDVERHTVSVAWAAEDVQQLLRDTRGDAITFAFERDQLEQLLASDTELHGLREKALVLSVAFAAAAGTASVAQAAYDQGGWSERGTATASVAAHDEQTLAQRGIESTVAASHDEATLAARGIEPAVAASHDEATLAARGIEPAVAASHDEATLAARGIEPAVAASHDEATLAARGIEPAVAASHDEATLAARGIEPVVAASHDEATLAQRGIPDEFVATHDEATMAARGIPTPADAPVVSVADDGPALDARTAAALGLAGGVGLLIAGAAFVARRERGLHPA